jgi:hypothetical protein
MPMPSRFDLVDRIIPEGLSDYLNKARENGESFSTIARRLYVEHGVDVTGETVRQWFGQVEAASA